MQLSTKLPVSNFRSNNLPTRAQKYVSFGFRDLNDMAITDIQDGAFNQGMNSMLITL